MERFLPCIFSYQPRWVWCIKRHPFSPFTEDTRLNKLVRTHDPFDGDVFKKIIKAIRLDGYIVLTDFLPPDMLNSLFLDLKARDSEEFDRAGTGREEHFRLNKFVRSDRICWIDESSPATRQYLDWMEQFRLRINQALYLGLFDYECHYAYYPKNGFYRKHLDALKGKTNRVLSTVLYLNPNWQASDGGELIMYSEDDDVPMLRILPTWGKMVIFLSEYFPHEVLPANQRRFSLTGWFRVNTNIGARLDPPA